jgi:hypothetical protein
MSKITAINEFDHDVLSGENILKVTRAMSHSDADVIPGLVVWLDRMISLKEQAEKERDHIAVQHSLCISERDRLKAELDQRAKFLLERDTMCFDRGVEILKLKKALKEIADTDDGRSGNLAFRVLDKNNVSRD